MNSMKVNAVDVFFIQEGNQNLVKALQHNAGNQFEIIEKLTKNSTSMILIRRKKFPKITDYRE